MTRTCRKPLADRGRGVLHVELEATSRRVIVPSMKRWSMPRYSAIVTALSVIGRRRRRRTRSRRCRTCRRRSPRAPAASRARGADGVEVGRLRVVAEADAGDDRHWLSHRTFSFLGRHALGVNSCCYLSIRGSLGRPSTRSPMMLRIPRRCHRRCADRDASKSSAQTYVPHSPRVGGQRRPEHIARQLPIWRRFSESSSLAIDVSAPGLAGLGAAAARGGPLARHAAGCTIVGVSLADDRVGVAAEVPGELAEAQRPDPAGAASREPIDDARRRVWSSPPATRRRVAQHVPIGDEHVLEEDLVEASPPVICRSGRTSMPGACMSTSIMVRPRVWGRPGRCARASRRCRL